uniref:Uncharacterized protein n=1 Tax=Rhizophora mucronata TaxID=61149 RepID=A0A2P2NGP0_RHIMU
MAWKYCGFCSGFSLTGKTGRLLPGLRLHMMLMMLI